MDFSRALYLLLTLAALAFPVRRFGNWFFEHGLDWELLTAELSATVPALGASATVAIVTVAALTFMIGEACTRRDWLSLICVPLTLILGVAVGLSFYLFLRLRPLR